MGSCNKDFNFLLVAARLGSTACVLLILIFVMYAFTTKIVSGIRKVANVMPHSCCEKEHKTNSYKNDQYPSYEKPNSQFQQNDPDYISMRRSNTFSYYTDRPSLFNPISFKNKKFTK